MTFQKMSFKTVLAFLFSIIIGNNICNAQKQDFASVKISDQEWMIYNLNVDHFQNGERIPEARTLAEWLKAGKDHKPAWCYYKNNAKNGKAFGKLYNWWAIIEKRSLAPKGWRIPNKNDYETLLNYIGYASILLVTQGQGKINNNGNSLTGFNAMLAGYRREDGEFYSMGKYAYFGCLDNNAGGIFIRDIRDPFVRFFEGDPRRGYSIRCIKDNKAIPQLSSPPNGISDAPYRITIKWHPSPGFPNYVLQVSEIDETFSINNLVYYADTGRDTSVNLAYLEPNKKYFWRVKSHNLSGSTDYSEVWSFKTRNINVAPCAGLATINYGGKTYHTIQIASQCWLKENLDIGEMVAGDLEQKDNGKIEKYCYNNDPVNCVEFGGLYQWGEAMQYLEKEKVQGICPSGFHIPSKNEFEVLKTVVNGNGNALKEWGEGSKKGFGENYSGFSALLSGARYRGGYFGNLSDELILLCSTQNNNAIVYANLFFLNDKFDICSIMMKNMLNDGYSVRCIKD
jgi:uncharacterized protein (TIGR02145 family)